MTPRAEGTGGMNRCGPHLFFSPFYRGLGFYAGWRWEFQFQRDYPQAALRVQSDMFDALIRDGLVTA